MKQLKFAEPLPELVLNGSKTSTWRINDKRGIEKNDQLSLRYDDGREFARAFVIDIKEITFGELSEKDKMGHESFVNDEAMYTTYSRYYNITVTSETNLKIIRFKLVDKIGGNI